MLNFRLIAGGAALIVATHAAALIFGAQPAGPPKRFPAAKVRFEQNATDGDVEVVFEITGRSEGVTKLNVESPDGRMVVDFASDESGAANASGIREFLFESPEPTDIPALKAAYPEGIYTIKGETKSGFQLRSTAKLSHKLPPTTKLVSPKAESRDVAVRGVNLTWKPVPGVAAYMLELEQEDTESIITATLPAANPSFSVPKDFLKPGMEYKLGIGTVSKDGNVSFIETSFTTAKGK
jgi:hypothetical protein